MQEAGHPCGKVLDYRVLFLENVVDSGQQHSGNGNDGLFVSMTLFECKVTISDFRELLGTDGIKSALNKQRFDVGSGATDSGGFLLSGTFVVLWRKTSPGA